VACASIDLLLEQDWQQRICEINQALQQLHQCGSLTDVANVRTLGAIGVVELTDEAGIVDVAKIQAYFVSQGVWIRPFGKLIYLMPPYISDDASIKQLCDAIYNAIKGKHYV
jgi:adenosylmethionine-8-amino-7-oxononanoate aminotransferase